jgi:hypothetical protein
MQNSLIRREEAICNNQWRIARSKRPLQRMRALEDDLCWRSLKKNRRRRSHGVGA